jgi:WD40 repeat protein
VYVHIDLLALSAGCGVRACLPSVGRGEGLMEPDHQLGLPVDGTPSLLTANLASSEDGRLVYAGHNSIYVAESGTARQLKLQEDGNVHRACWVSVSGSEKLVAAAQNSVQIWDADGSLLYLCWALPPPAESFGGAYYASSVAAVSPTESIYVGSSAGDLFVFSSAGDMISYRSTAVAHDSAVTALASNDSTAPSVLVSGSGSGEIKVWDAFSMSTTIQISGSGFGVTSLALCEGFIIAGFETGARWWNTPVHFSRSTAVTHGCHVLCGVRSRPYV